MIPKLLSIVTAVAISLHIPSIPDKAQVLSDTNYSLTNRYSNEYVNGVFADNILLTLAYFNGSVKQGQDFSWDSVKAGGEFTEVIQPGETFAFHDNVLDKYEGKVRLTTNAHFISSEGFKSDGWLVGDGVCHLASFISVAAKKAGLEVDAPTRHDFAKIPDVSREDGVSIYYSPDNSHGSALQNLYITNNHPKPIAFVFKYNAENLDIKVAQLN